MRDLARAKALGLERAGQEVLTMFWFRLVRYGWVEGSASTLWVTVIVTETSRIGIAKQLRDLTS